MTLPVPLVVRVGNTRLTRQVQSLSFRKEAVGGLRSISFGLSRPLTQIADITPLTKVYVSDARNGGAIGEGRLADTGRAAGSDGQKWDCVAFGPAQHASDWPSPLIYVDRRISDDAWEYVDIVHPAATSFSSGTRPNDATPAAPQGLLAVFNGDLNINTNSRVVRRYTPVWQSGQKIARVAFNWVTSTTFANWRVRARTSLDGTTTGENAYDAAWTTAGGTAAPVVVTDFPNGRNAVELQAIWTGGAAAIGADGDWAWFEAIMVRSMLTDKAGADITTGYTNNYVLAHEVVGDLLGRRLPEYDGANATVTTTTQNIDQLAYPDGVTPAQVLDDLMQVEPAFRWYTTPDLTGSGKYGFRWEQWPTTVRYEATLDDGGSFPVSTQTIYNRAVVKYTDATGGRRWSGTTSSNPLLGSLVRQAVIDLGSEAGAAATATAAGNAFLAENSVPKNSGTLTVSRPIRDMIRGCWVQPWEIEPGELIRVRGVEGYASAFNASDSDGQSVFRIFANDYTSEGNTATLALDSDPRETEDALVKLLNQRTRR